MKDTETIWVNFLTATPEQLKSAERRKQRLEDAGYRLVQTSSVAMTYKREV